MDSNNRKYKKDLGERYPLVGNFIHYHLIHNKIKIVFFILNNLTPFPATGAL